MCYGETLWGSVLNIIITGPSVYLGKCSSTSACLSESTTDPANTTCFFLNKKDQTRSKTLKVEETATNLTVIPLFLSISLAPRFGASIRGRWQRAFLENPRKPEENLQNRRKLMKTVGKPSLENLHFKPLKTRKPTGLLLNASFWLNLGEWGPGRRWLPSHLLMISKQGIKVLRCRTEGYVHQQKPLKFAIFNSWHKQYVISRVCCQKRRRNHMQKHPTTCFPQWKETLYFKTTLENATNRLNDPSHQNIQVSDNVSSIQQ